MIEMLFTALLLVVIIRTIFVFFQKGKIEKQDNAILKTESTLDLLCTLLKKLNCQPEIEKEKEDVSITFDFQGGHFRIIMQPTNPYIGLSFLYFFETALEHLNLVRHLCNDLSIKCKISKCVYTIDEPENVVHTHILSGFILTKEIPGVETYFEGLLTDCFELKNAFIQLFNQQQEEKENDPELESAEHSRKRFLLCEQEFAHQLENWQWRIHETKKLTLDELLNLFLDSEDIQLKELKVVTYELSIQSDPLLISSFDLLSPMIKSVDGKTTLCCEHCTLIITYFLPSKMRAEDSQTIIFNIKSEGMAENTYHFRVTCTLPALGTDKEVSLNSERNKPQSYSFIVAYDESLDTAKKVEFDYIWEDAKDKIQNGRQHELSDEQRLICDCTLSNAAYHLYWGEKRFLSKRYYEALLHLENAYYMLQGKFHELNDSEKESFYETCYLIGFCYCELRQYQRAYFFLDITFSQNRITHTEEYVNCLANSKDFRAIYIIDNLINSLQQHHETSGEEKPPHIISFVNFLSRRKAYVLIDLGKLDEAAEIFTKMLDEPENSDYALTELAYIERLKGQKQNT
ncbi:hypothetical protein LJC54_01940 [Parabacteroides sp. OttesenSCG-928-J18]|nr:hypothetical protein [Parabacteroides sp. OttesenSCG-928-J18]